MGFEWHRRFVEFKVGVGKIPPCGEGFGVQGYGEVKILVGQLHQIPLGNLEQTG